MTDSGDDDRSEGPAQDLAFRVLSAGLAGLFSTQEALRRAVGDALPEEWVDFAVQQSDRARQQFFDRVAEQMTGAFEKLDMQEFLTRLLEDHVVEVEATIRLRPPGAATGGRKEPAGDDEV